MPTVDEKYVSDVTAAIRDCATEEETIARVTALLEDIEDPEQIRGLAYICDEMVPNVSLPSTIRSNAYQAWSLCVLRLRDIGRAGSEEAVQQLWLMHTSGRYDAGDAEWFPTCISEVGPPAIPVLEKVREDRAMARAIIKAIREGRVLQ